ncbi:MAG: AMP-binding protein [Verrucomicrobiales bacterium]|nr:AMP-binding protein [Verrucomicrobiales bacterium]
MSAATPQIPAPEVQIGRVLRRDVPPPEFEAGEVERSIPERFEVVARRNPDRLAVRDGDLQWTYAQVRRMAGRVAAAVLEILGPDPAPVALLFDVEAAAIPAIYGVLAAGKFYVPLDPGLPPARLGQLLEDTGCRLLLTRGTGIPLASGLDGVRVVDVDALQDPSDPPKPAAGVGPGSQAYIIYTSGSTGRPKGVIQTHRTVLADMRRQGRDLATDAADRYGLLFSAASSASACSVFGALLNGAAVTCYDLKRRGVAPMAEWFATHEVSICDISVATLRLFAATLKGTERFPKMRMIAPGGEPLYRADIELCRRIFTGNCVVQNSLGTTETRTATQYFMDRETPVEDALVPVGYPVEGKEVLLLDADGREADEGEIVIRSRYLSPGYWRRPELTAAVFLPVAGEPDVFLYRTGDLGRRLPDGRLVHLGRKDFQVKIHGYRVEIAEVEDVLLRLQGVEDAAVVARSGPGGVMRLVAFVVPRPGELLTVARLRTACGRELPAYAIPSEFLRVAELPKTANGKLNRKQLTESGQGQPFASAGHVPPRDELERALCDLWQRLLGHPQVGIEDDFFLLGGDSVRAMQCLLEVESTFGRRLTPSVFLPTATVAVLAQRLREPAADSTAVSLVPLKEGGPGRPLYLVHSIYGSFLHYRALLESADFGRPVFGIQCPVGTAGPNGANSLEAMAAASIAALRAFQPAGPYALAGHSFGGLLAYEMARQLRESGHAVSFVGILDTDLGLHREMRRDVETSFAAFFRNLPFHFRDRGVRGLVGNRWAIFRHRWRTRGRPPQDRSFEFRDLDPELRRLAWSHVEAARAYVPKPIRGEAWFFGATVRPLFRPRNPAEVWRTLVPEGLRVHLLPGNHFSILTEPSQVVALATALASALRTTDGAGPSA